MRRLMTFLCFLLVNTALPAFAQPADRRPAPAAEFTLGYAGFVDEGMINHTVVGGALRFPLSPRVSVGPEVQYMIGPGSDRDFILTGNITFDLLPPNSRVTPFLVAGGGLFRHSDKFASGTFASSEGAFTAGGGVRSWVSDRVYVAADFRGGWELHYRVAGTVGIALSPSR